MYNVCVAVLCRNRTLFRREFRSHCCIRSAILLNFRQGRGSYALHRLIRYMHLRSTYEAALNGSSAIRCFKHSEAIEIRDGIIYTGLCFFFLTDLGSKKHEITTGLTSSGLWDQQVLSPIRNTPSTTSQKKKMKVTVVMTFVFPFCL